MAMNSMKRLVHKANRRVGFAVLAATVGIVAVPPALAEVATSVVVEGDTVAGSLVTGLNNPAVNGVRGYGFGLIQEDGVNRFYGNATGGTPGVLRAEATIGRYVQTAFEFSWGIASSGSIAYSPTVNDTVTGQVSLDSVWLDDAPIYVGGDPVAALPGQFATFGSDPSISLNGVPAWIGGYAPSAGGATTGRALFRGSSAVPVLKSGDSIPAAGTTVSADGPSFGARLSGNGSNYIAVADLTGPTATDSALVLNGDLAVMGGGVLREGSPVPAAAGGLAGELWSAFDTVGVNDAGRYFVTGDTSAATAVDEFVATDAGIVLREGAALTTSFGPGTINGAIEWGDANEAMDYAVTWDVDSGGANREVLIVDGRAVLTEGDKLDLDGDGNADNSVILRDFNGVRSLAIGERFLVGAVPTVDVFFTASYDVLGTVGTGDDLEGGFRVTVAVPEPTAVTLAGASLLMLRRRSR